MASTLPPSRLFLLLDANVVADCFLGTYAQNKKAATSVQAIVEAVRTRSVQHVLLYLPTFCIPEVFSVFDKHAFGVWNSQVKRKLDVRRHRQLRRLFSSYIRHGAVFEQYELSRYHVLATDLVSPIDHRYQISRKTKKNKARERPMSAADHLVVAMAIVLGRVAGRDNVVLVTSDQRMVAVVNKARDKVDSAAARQLGLPVRAASLGYHWSADLFPRVLNLKTATKSELREVFGAWPIAMAQSARSKAARLPKWAIL